MPPAAANSSSSPAANASRSVMAVAAVPSK
jgi:hypothetical protein